MGHFKDLRRLCLNLLLCPRVSALEISSQPMLIDWKTCGFGCSLLTFEWEGGTIYIYIFGHIYHTTYKDVCIYFYSFGFMPVTLSTAKTLLYLSVRPATDALLILTV